MKERKGDIWCHGYDTAQLYWMGMEKKFRFHHDFIKIKDLRHNPTFLLKQSSVFDVPSSKSSWIQIVPPKYNTNPEETSRKFNF